jgi:molybdate transport system substrate-binding protein
MLRRQLLCAPIALAACRREGPPRPITVFAAASLRDVLTEAGRVWTTSTGRKVRFSFAASSAIARLIEQGEPADIIISADIACMDYLAARSLNATATRSNLFANRLALIAPAGSKTRLIIAHGFPLARALGEGRLAMAAPEVPAGRYAQAALTSLGVWGSVKDRTARGENVRTVLQFVARGEAPFGIVYDTDATAEPKVRVVGLFPAGSHPPILYPAALVVGGQTDAAGFLAWLRGPEAGAVFASYGFTRPRAVR